tara:strand:+ start:5473 stop:6159 length:687 start_codon:yes stop_codon:yes gene_type:complete
MARVLVIGDTHCPAMKEGYVDFLNDMKQLWNTDTTIHIGDVVDWASISFHEKLPEFPSPNDEFEKAMDQVQLLYKAFPKVTVMTGNHDDLPKRKITTLTLPSQCIKEYSTLWNTPKWNWMPRYSRYNLDNVIYSHGDSGKGGRWAALSNATDNFSSWVQGHLHSVAGVNYYANVHKRIFGLSTGCGVDHDALSMYYGKRFNSKPIVGCGIVLDGEHAFFEPMPFEQYE